MDWQRYGQWEVDQSTSQTVDFYNGSAHTAKVAAVLFCFWKEVSEIGQFFSVSEQVVLLFWKEVAIFWKEVSAFIAQRCRLRQAPVVKAT